MQVQITKSAVLKVFILSRRVKDILPESKLSLTYTSYSSRRTKIQWTNSKSCDKQWVHIECTVQFDNAGNEYTMSPSLLCLLLDDFVPGKLT